jgi:hypothetical protein
MRYAVRALSGAGTREAPGATATDAPGAGGHVGAAPRGAGRRDAASSPQCVSVRRSCLAPACHAPGVVRTLEHAHRG